MKTKGAQNVINPDFSNLVSELQGALMKLEVPSSLPREELGPEKSREHTRNDSAAVTPNLSTGTIPRLLQQDGYFDKLEQMYHHFKRQLCRLEQRKSGRYMYIFI